MTGAALVFLTRAGCPLCDEALPAARAAARLLRRDLVVVDVEVAGLADDYGNRIPVVLAPNGTEIASGRFGTVGLVWRLLRAARRTRRPTGDH
jgi:hypothetical protein